MTDQSISENDKLLRQEIIESQKTQADFLKWKLITVAAVASISLGLTSKNCNPTNDSAKLLICLIPLLCAYIDLISLHIMIRVITIGSYLTIYGNNYERYVFAVRLRSGTNPFVFEPVALHGSSMVFNAIVILLGLTLPQAFGHYWRRLNPATVSGVLGIGVTGLLWIIYVIRAKGVIELANRFKQSEDAA